MSDVLQFSFRKSGQLTDLCCRHSRVPELPGDFPCFLKRPLLNSLLDTLLDTDRADSIAHPFSPEKMDFFNEAEKAAVLAALTDNELGDILAKGERAGCMWELHAPTFFGFPAFSKRFFHIGKEVGVHFSFGTDAHTLDGIGAAGYAERMKKIL